MKDTWIKLREKTIHEGMLIHSITSPIAINDCANVVLALGAKPIMAEHPDEVAEITAIAKALTVSYANITDARRRSIMIAGKKALDNNIPCIVDAVGVTCSSMRMQDVNTFIKECKPTIVKGNVSEIKALAGLDFKNTGIDVSLSDKIEGKDKSKIYDFADAIKEYAKSIDSIVVATGEVDVISDGDICFIGYNGSSNMAKVTGTGCILTCIMGVYMACADRNDKRAQLTAASLALTTMGLVGEMADSTKGLGTYHMSFIDKLSLLTSREIVEQARFDLICR